MRNQLILIILALIAIPQAQAGWQNCSTVTKVVGGAAGAAVGAKLGGKFASRFGKTAAKKSENRTAGQLVGGLLGASGGAKAACVFTDRFTDSDRNKIANVNQTSLSKRGRSGETWTNDDGKTIDYTAEATTVEVKEYAGTTCKQVNGSVKVSAKDADASSADNTELYCESDDGQWVAAEGTVL